METTQKYPLSFRFLLLAVATRACGYKNLQQFNFKDLSTFKYEMHKLSGIPYAGII